MSKLIAVLLYLLMLFVASTVLFFSLTSLWETDEPIIVFLLSLITSHLVLHSFGEFENRKGKF